MIHLLPEEYPSRPSLLMIKVWAFAVSWHLGAMIKVLDQVEALIEAGKANLDADNAQVLRGQIA
jgi:hypothetical protein